MDSPAGLEDKEYNCFSIHTAERTYDIAVDDTRDMSIWYLGLQALVQPRPVFTESDELKTLSVVWPKIESEGGPQNNRTPHVVYQGKEYRVSWVVSPEEPEPPMITKKVQAKK